MHQTRVFVPVRASLGKVEVSPATDSAWLGSWRLTIEGQARSGKSAGLVI